MFNRAKHFWSKIGVFTIERDTAFPENFLEKNSVLNEKVSELQQKVSDQGNFIKKLVADKVEVCGQ